MTNHKWQNIDKGTVGWYRCSVCGLRRHFPASMPVIDLGESCEDRLARVVKILADKMTTLLHNSDADTVTVRGLLAISIVQHEVDSPYTRG